MKWDVDVYQLSDGWWTWQARCEGIYVQGDEHLFRWLAKRLAVREVRKRTWSELHRLRFQVSVHETA